MRLYFLYTSFFVYIIVIINYNSHFWSAKVLLFSRLCKSFCHFLSIELKKGNNSLLFQLYFVLLRGKKPSIT